MANAIKSKLSGLVPRFEGVFAGAFRDGLIGGAVLFALLSGWMAMRSTDTAWKLQEFLPSKSATIEEKQEKPAAEAQPGLEEVRKLNALPPAPIVGLAENFEGRQLPIIRIEDDMTSFQAYKKPFAPVAGRPMVSIVVIDFGLSDMLSKSILDNMPPEISLGLSPYSDAPSKWGSAARAYGHEFWIGLPMQTREYGVDDSGPSTLLVNANEDENRKRLFTILSEASGYAGVIAQKDHEFPPAGSVSEPIYKQIFGRGLAIAESNPDTAAFGLSAAMQDGYPYVQNTMWLDADLRPDAVERSLQQLERLAQQNGKAVAFLHPYPAVMNKVQDWIKTADDKGIQIAPLSAMVQ